MALSASSAKLNGPAGNEGTLEAAFPSSRQPAAGGRGPLASSVGFRCLTLISNVLKPPKDLTRYIDICFPVVAPFWHRRSFASCSSSAVTLKVGEGDRPAVGSL